MANHTPEGERTGHSSEAERILEAEADRLLEELREDHMLDDPQERAVRTEIAMLETVNAILDRIGEHDRRLDAIELALERIGPEPEGGH